MAVAVCTRAHNRVAAPKNRATCRPVSGTVDNERPSLSRSLHSCRRYVCSLPCMTDSSGERLPHRNKAPTAAPIAAPRRCVVYGPCALVSFCWERRWSGKTCPSGNATGNCQFVDLIFKCLYTHVLNQGLLFHLEACQPFRCLPASTTFHGLPKTGSRQSVPQRGRGQNWPTIKLYPSGSSGNYSGVGISCLMMHCSK